MPNRRYYQDQQRSNEPYNARSEYGRRRRSESSDSAEYDRGEDRYDRYEGDRSRYGSPRSGSFTGGDFGRGYEPGRYQETYGGHGIYEEPAHHRPHSYGGDRTGGESEFQNRGRNYEARDEYRRDYDRDRSSRGQSSFRGNYPNRSDFPESERGYYNDTRFYNEEERGWWDKAADEVSSWMGDEEAARRREIDHRRNAQYRGYGPRNYKRSDDRIKEDINDRLTDHAYLDASEIDVEVNAGEVVLTGAVMNRYAKRMAEDIADDVSGVKNVENRLRVESKASWVAGAGDINAAGNRTKFPDISEPKSMSKNAGS